VGHISDTCYLSRSKGGLELYTIYWRNLQSIKAGISQGALVRSRTPVGRPNTRAQQAPPCTCAGAGRAQEAGSSCLDLANIYRKNKGMAGDPRPETGSLFALEEAGVRIIAEFESAAAAVLPPRGE
jgi:hypothetical protein